MADSLARIVRAGEWWDYKLVPILALFYATALSLEVPVASLWPGVLALLLSLIPGAAYVSLVNDITDLAGDVAAGKANRMVERSHRFRAAALLLSLAGGGVFMVLWRDDPLLLGAYICAWIAFTLYSVPPFRLKTRGLPGLLADASGAHLFPTLVAAILAFRAAGIPLDPVWLAAAGAWALGYGLRGILWHQLSDIENDRAASVRTFAQRHSPRLLVRIGAYAAFPLELVGLAALFWMMQHPLPPLLLALHFLLVRRRINWWGMNAVVVEPRPRYLILLRKYYDVLLPMGILLASSLAHPVDLIVVALHLLLFPRRAFWQLVEAWQLRSHHAARRPYE